MIEIWTRFLFLVLANNSYKFYLSSPLFLFIFKKNLWDISTYYVIYCFCVWIINNFPIFTFCSVKRTFYSMGILLQKNKQLCYLITFYSQMVTRILFYDNLFLSFSFLSGFIYLKFFFRGGSFIILPGYWVFTRNRGRDCWG